MGEDWQAANARGLFVSIRPFKWGCIVSAQEDNSRKVDASIRHSCDSNRKALTEASTPMPKLYRFRCLIAGTFALQLAGTTGFEGSAWTGAWRPRGRCRVCERPTKFDHITGVRRITKVHLVCLTGRKPLVGGMLTDVRPQARGPFPQRLGH